MATAKTAASTSKAKTTAKPKEPKPKPKTVSIPLENDSFTVADFEASLEFVGETAQEYAIEAIRRRLQGWD